MRKSSLNPAQERKLRELVYKSGPVGVYKMVLDGTLKQFPKGFWSMPENIDYARDCTMYLIEKVLKWDKEQIKENFGKDTLAKYKLMGMYIKVCNNSVYKAINYAYPNKYKPWELRRMGFIWSDETKIEAIKWLVEDRLKIDPRKASNIVDVQIMKDNELCTLLKDCSISKLLSMAYPDIYKEEMCRKALKDRRLKAKTNVLKNKHKENMRIKSEDDIIKVYKDVLGNKIGIFPTGFWEGEYREYRLKVCIRYVMDEVLKVNKSKLRVAVTTENKRVRSNLMQELGINREKMLELRLYNAIKHCYSANIGKAIKAAYGW